jgi:hypothetical protein
MPRLNLRPDVSETAFRVLQEAIGERPKTPPPAERTEKNPEGVRRGSAIAKKAATTRWRPAP